MRIASKLPPYTAPNKYTLDVPEQSCAYGFLVFNKIFLVQSSSSIAVALLKTHSTLNLQERREERAARCGDEASGPPMPRLQTEGLRQVIVVVIAIASCIT